MLLDQGGWLVAASITHRHTQTQTHRHTSPPSQALDHQDDHDAMRNCFAENEFLNQTHVDEKGVPTDQPKYDWRSPFEEVVADGGLRKWELLDCFDSVTNAYFFEVRDARKKREQLQAELKEQIGST